MCDTEPDPRKNILPLRAFSDRQSAEQLKLIIRVRKARKHFFPLSILADPRWRLLLEAYYALLEQRRISVSNLCDAADVSRSASLRWIKTLQEERMLVRKTDPNDHRATWVELSPRGESAMRRYFEAIANALPI